MYDFEQLINSKNPKSVAPLKIFNSDTSTIDRFGCMQLSVNGRMFIAARHEHSKGRPYLYMLDKPDTSNPILYKLGGTSNGKYFLGATTLDDPNNGREEGFSSYGLPNFSPSWLDIDIIGNGQICVNIEHPFSLKIIDPEALNKLKYTVWNFGDGTATVENNEITGLQQYQTHIYTTTGTYEINVVGYDINRKPIPEINSSLEVTVENCIIRINPHLSVGFKE